jgi:hypothetical protein
MAALDMGYGAGGNAGDRPSVALVFSGGARCPSTTTGPGCFCSVVPLMFAVAIEK